MNPWIATCIGYRDDRVTIVRNGGIRRVVNPPLLGKGLGRIGMGNCWIGGFGSFFFVRFVFLKGVWRVHCTVGTRVFGWSSWTVHCTIHKRREQSIP